MGALNPRLATFSSTSHTTRTKVINIGSFLMPACIHLSAGHAAKARNCMIPSPFFKFGFFVDYHQHTTTIYLVVDMLNLT